MGRHMQVYVRLYPTPARDWQYLDVSQDCKDVYVHNKILSNSLDGKKVDKYVKFPTSGVFINNSQEEIYKTVSQDLFTKIFNGENVIIMASGQHDSGKSFSMTGYGGLFENRGLSLRLVDDLFNEIDYRKHELRTELFVSYMDFAAENMIDLLTEPATHIYNLNQMKKIKVYSKEELMKLMLLAEKRRWIEGLSSHCATSVMTLYLKCTSKIKSQPYDYFPHVQLVELCGAETASKMTTCQIKSNKDVADMSLYLASSKTVCLSRSPSKLVAFLANTWNNSFIRIICHLKPTAKKSQLNMSSMLFVNRLMRRPMYCYNLQRSDNPINNMHYALEMIERLEEEMVIREMILGIGFRHAETVNQKDMDFALSACTKFLNSEISIESLLSTAHPHILIKAMKKKFELLAPSQKDGKSSQPLPQSLSNITYKLEKLSASKLNSWAKKRLSNQTKDLKKGGGTSMETTDLAFKNSFEGIEEQKQSQDIPDRKTVEAEFFTRYPGLRIQLELALENHNNAIRIRDEAYSEYEKLKREAQEEKVLEEDAMWKRKLEYGECVGPDGKVLWSLQDERPAQEAALAAKRDAADAIEAYTYARDTLAEIRNSIEEKIQAYMDTAYGLWTPTIDNEEIKPCYEKSDLLLGSREKITLEDIKKRDLFYEIQASRKSSNPFKREIRWMR